LKKLFANIALDIPIDSIFTYEVPDYLFDYVSIGMRVLVPFGNRTLTGFVIGLTDSTEVQNTKQIKSCLDSEPVLTNEMIKFAKFISDYYLSNLGEVLSLFIPKKLSVNSEIYFSLTDNYIVELNNLSKANEVIFDIVNVILKSKDRRLTKKQIENKLNQNITYSLELLVKKNIIQKEKLYTKTTQVLLVKYIRNKTKNLPLDDVKKEFGIKTLKQIELYELLIQNKEIELTELRKNFQIPDSTVKSFVNKGIAEIFEIKKERRPDNLFEEEMKLLVLNDEQKNAVDKISESIRKNEFKTFLLFGVTGSGKTEVYIRLLENAIKENKQGIVLVPEISLTPQLIKRFKNKFGDKIGVIHSKLSEGERLDTYTGIRDGKYDIVVGPRSALFSPLKNIGVIIVDEEHDHSYKQDNSPFYNARDMAIIRSKINNGVCVLGSATPSVESFFNAKSKRYELLTLKKRATKSALPFVKVIDLKYKYATDGYDFKEDIEKLKIKFLSKELIYSIDRRLENKESILLLQNRRGYHSYIECVSCGLVEQCERCNISLTYHKHIDLLKCHLCGFTKKRNFNCSNCGSSKLISSGAGTEKIEEEILEIFPKAIIERMDSDTMTSKSKYQKVLSDFYKAKIDILVGTQIISKGLDFPNVTLVGVVNSDIGLLLPDFRAAEKTFQLLTQVSGRSGRSDKPGEVIIQTKHSEYKLFSKVIEHDYDGFYDYEIKLREMGEYPPYSRIGLIEIKTKDFNVCKEEANKIYFILKKFKYKDYLTILTPSQPLFSKVKDQNRFHIIVKSLKSNDPSGKLLIDSFKFVKENYTKQKDVKIIYDIDCMSFL